MKYNAEIFKGVKNVGRRKNVSIEIFGYAENLYEVLEAKKFIQRLEETPLLGNLTGFNNKHYTRMDYVNLQLYLYNFVNNKLNAELEPSLNTRIKVKEFKDCVYPIGKKEEFKEMSVADALQILVYVYNIGHFKNTFTSSISVINILRSDSNMKNDFINNFNNLEHQKIAKSIIENNKYHRFHLLNSLLLLLNIKEKTLEIKIAINLISEYLKDSECSSNKLKGVFSIFKEIRGICFVTLDLAVAPLPLYLDLQNEHYLILLLKEKLSNYNNNTQITNLFKGFNKLLQDTVYNEEVKTINQYDIARRMKKRLLKSESLKKRLSNKYLDFVVDEKGSFNIFNKKYLRNNDFDTKNILKITFGELKQEAIEELTDQLNRKNFVKAAWYYRKNENKVTLLVSIKKACDNKIKVSFGVMKIISNKINSLHSQFPKEENYFHLQTLLATNFFLYYLFDENKVLLSGKVDKQTCVILKRGNKSRLNALSKLINNNISSADDDQLHEMKVIKIVLLKDNKQDLGITICSSIEVLNKENKTIQEFDGLLIFPNRDKNQVVFLESKNTKNKPSKSVNQLKEKFKNLKIEYVKENIVNIDKSCKYLYLIKS